MTQGSFHFELLVNACLMAAGLWLSQSGLYNLGLFAVGAALLAISLATHLPRWKPAMVRAKSPLAFLPSRLER